MHEGDHKGSPLLWTSVVGVEAGQTAMHEGDHPCTRATTRDRPYYGRWVCHSGIGLWLVGSEVRTGVLLDIRGNVT